jgi:hypothetical protein
MARSYGRGADVTPQAVLEEPVLEHIADSGSTESRPTEAAARAIVRPDRFFEPGLLRLFEHDARPTICYPRVRLNE